LYFGVFTDRKLLFEEYRFGINIYNTSAELDFVCAATKSGKNNNNKTTVFLNKKKKRKKRKKRGATHRKVVVH